MKDLTKRPLFVYEMANNHMGDVDHGIRIIRELRQASAGFPFNFCIKLQYRDLDTCIHPAYKGRFDLKYVKRFLKRILAGSSTSRSRTRSLTPVSSLCARPGMRHRWTGLPSTATTLSSCPAAI